MEINLLAVFVCSLFSFILGIFWYSKLLFADLFMKSMGNSEEEMKEGFALPAIFEFITTFVTNYILALIIFQTNADNFWKGFQIGMLLWIGFIVLTQLSTVTFEKRNFQLYLIQVSYRLIAIPLSAGILAIWK